MTLVEFCPEAIQLTHDLNEAALRLCILILKLFCLTLSLLQCLLQDNVLLQCLCKLSLVFLDYAASSTNTLFLHL